MITTEKKLTNNTTNISQQTQKKILYNNFTGIKNQLRNKIKKKSVQKSIQKKTDKTYVLSYP